MRQRKKPIKQFRPESANAKPFTATQAKMFVVEHLGTMTYRVMAEKLQLSEDRIWQISAELRKERELITKELVSTKAEEQCNRLNMNTVAAWADVMNLRNRISKLRDKSMDLEGQKHQDIGNKQGIRTQLSDVQAELAVAERNLFDYTRAYTDSENSLTRFLKAVGIYQPDIKVEDNRVQVLNLNLENALKSVREDYGDEMAKKLEDQLKAQRQRKNTILEIEGRDVTDNGRQGRGVNDTQAEAQEGTRGHSPQTPAQDRKAGQLQGLGQGQPQRENNKPDARELLERDRQRALAKRLRSGRKEKGKQRDKGKHRSNRSASKGDERHDRRNK